MMKIDWQIILVALIVLAAFAYVARGALANLRSMTAKKNDAAASSCGGSCGCAIAASTKTQNASAALVGITRTARR